jgi:hypothetical protein
MRILRQSTMAKRKRWATVGLVFAFVLALGVWELRQAIYHVSAARYAHVPLEPGNVEVPTTRSLQWRDQSELTEQVLEHWANQPLGDWQTQGKVAAPRALMGRFAMRRELDAANAYLMEQKPWGNAGSTWEGHPEGDYDFTLAGITPILFLFGDDPAVLCPQTRDHLLNTLLPLEGGDPLVKVPRTLGLVPDTENHLLMTEGSRYLKNRWLALHGSSLSTHDNVANGLEEWLLTLIEELRTAGLYEFNSIPYEGYTLTALLNLDAFGSLKIQSATRELLDQLNWKYALGSLSFRRFPPFRRQYAHASDTALDGDRHVALIKSWISVLPDGPEDLVLTESHHIAIWACWAPYRLPDQTARWILDKPEDYYVRMGHGAHGSPEIYSGGPGYLLSAGGVNRGERSLLVARPITLILDDGATDLSQVLHLAGPGEDFRQWNNTGVWREFAVTAGPVRIPEDWKPDAEAELWKVFHRDRDLCVAVHSRANLGVVHLIRSSDPADVLASLQEANNDAGQLRNSFQMPDGSYIRYDTNAPHDRWVIQQIDDHSVDRCFDRWPSMDLRNDDTTGTNER